MRHPLCNIGLFVVTLVACSEKPQLSLGEKAKYTAELIEARPGCEMYAQPLSRAITDVKIVEEAYENAKVAHCLKPDV